MHLFVFVCCTLNYGNAVLFAILGFNRRLFAVLKKRHISPESALFVAPTFPVRYQGESCPFNRINQTRHNRRRFDLTPNKANYTIDSDMPKLEALQRFKPSEQIRSCAILQRLHHAITTACISRFSLLIHFPMIRSCAHMPIYSDLCQNPF